MEVLEPLTRLGGRVQAFGLGEMVARAGDPAGELYVVLSGRLRLLDATNPARTVVVLGTGEVFGEQAFSASPPEDRCLRFAVRAASAGEISIIDGAAVRRLLADDRQFGEWLGDIAAERERLWFWFTARDLRPIAAGDVHRLRGSATRRHFEGPFAISTPAVDRPLLIEQGRADLIRRAGDAGDVVARAGRGEIVGPEPWLEGSFEPLEPQPCGSRPLTVWCLDPADFLSARDHTGRPASNAWRHLRRRYERLARLSREPDSEVESRALWGSVAVPLQSPAGNDLVRKWVDAGGRRLPSTTVAAAAEQAGVAAVNACLDMLCRLHGLPFSAERVAWLQVPDDADPLPALAEGAEALGLLSRPVTAPPRRLPAPAVGMLSEVPVVMLRGTRRGAWLGDPRRGLRFEAWRELETGWSGRALLVDLPLVHGSEETASEEIATSTTAPATKRRGAELLRALFADRSLLCGILAVSLWIQLFGLVLPLVTREVVDRVILGGDGGLLPLLALASITVILFQLLAGRAREYAVTHLLMSISVDLQRAFKRHILRLHRSRLDSWAVGDLVQRFEENEKVLQLVARSGFKAVVDSAAVVVYLLVMAVMSLELAVIAALLVAVYGGLMVWASPRLRRSERLVFDTRGRIERGLIDSFTSLETIKAHGLESLWSRLVGERFARHRRAEVDASKLAYGVQWTGELLRQGALLAVLVLGARLVLSGQLSPGELVACNALYGSLTAPLSSLVAMADELQELRVSLDRTGQVLEQESERPGDGTAPPLDGPVRVLGVGFKYPGAARPALDGIELEIKPGERLAVVGPSGGGKSTLLRVLARTLEPTMGRVLWGGRDLRKWPRAALRQGLVLVEQETFLFAGTLGENVGLMAAPPAPEVFAQAAAVAGVADFVGEFPDGYESILAERGVGLSGGQRQRVALARALVREPHLLLLDEATSALDLEWEEEIHRRLADWLGARSLVFVTHRLHTAATRADRIAVVDGGRLVAVGEHTDLLKNCPAYRHLSGVVGEQAA